MFLQFEITRFVCMFLQFEITIFVCMFLVYSSLQSLSFLLLFKFNN
jgi:hypothetical protein